MAIGASLAIACATISVFSPLRAEHTRFWRQSTYEEFLKGKVNGIAIRSDGRLELAPKFTLLADVNASYLWTLRADNHGSLYAAGGSPARAFRVDPNGGKPSQVFESAEMAAQAIAFDSQGVLYVATSPEGKVYRVTANGEKSVFFDPKTKYIWDLAFAPDGTLYVATGDKGQVFAVSRSGQGELFYTSDDAHIRVLAFDKNGNLLAGTEPNGRVLRMTRIKNSGQRDASSVEGFVLYETNKREVTSLVVAPDGDIFAAAIGDKQRTFGQPNAPITSTPQSSVYVGGSTIVIGGGQTQPIGQATALPIMPSSIFRISPDGQPQELWTSRDQIVYALNVTADGRLLAGSGNNGQLLEIDGQGVFTELAKAGSAQITGIARDSGGRTFLCTANPGKIFALGPEYSAEGTYESQVFDARLFSQWGRIDWWESSSTKPSAGSDGRSVEFFVRAGNTEDPGKEWSHWFGPYAKPQTTVESPASRFVQWKAVIRGGRPGATLDWVSLAYLPRNVAPVVDAIALQDPGVRVQIALMSQPGQATPINLRTPQVISPVVPTVQVAPPAHYEQPPQGFAQKGYQSILWAAHDDNDDELRFAVYYRGENETEWKLLKDNLDQKFYSFDDTTLADGAYYLKVVASDAPSNAPADTQMAERISDRFIIDNTPPVIEHLEVAHLLLGTSGKNALVRFTARDATSSIDRAQFSIDGGDWILIAPVGNLSDAREERYEFTPPASSLTPGEHTVAVRAYDHFGNVGSAKTTFSVPATSR
jgi:hypothetical protein